LRNEWDTSRKAWQVSVVLRVASPILISFIGRILRLLATQHIFKEVAPDVFANNRISSVMDTYKPVAEINAKYVSILEALCFVFTSFPYPVPKTNTMERLVYQR